ncbi:hypothetical protein OE88DRAFT_1734084 [Heliocybe sulcata]|uniref:Uncharacterized protein n=1 Tax=Heliocybe sulcata TaxID=5364 RepID=A0A5C3NHT8_9AGAM|nr:hypothetical protein OE88DRAFT_1734084 [Heliocybe sulcata]
MPATRIPLATALRADIRELANAVEAETLSESGALHALSRLLPPDVSVSVRASLEWEFVASSREFLRATAVDVLRDQMADLPWALVKEVPPPSDAEPDDSVVVIHRTSINKAAGAYKEKQATGKSRKEKTIPAEHVLSRSQRGEKLRGEPNSPPCERCMDRGLRCHARVGALPATVCYECKTARKGCSRSAGIVSKKERLAVAEARREGQPISADKRASAERDEAEENSPTPLLHVAMPRPEVGRLGQQRVADAEDDRRRLKGNSLKNAPGPSHAADLKTRATTRKNAAASDGKSAGDKRPAEETDQGRTPKSAWVGVPAIDSQVFDATGRARAIGTIAPLPPTMPSLPTSTDTKSTLGRVVDVEHRQAHQEARVKVVEHNSRKTEEWMGAQQENATLRRAIQEYRASMRDMIAELERTVNHTW